MNRALEKYRSSEYRQRFTADGLIQVIVDEMTKINHEGKKTDGY